MLVVQFQESIGKQTSSFLPRIPCFTTIYTYSLLNSILNLILLVKPTRHNKSRSKHLTSIKTTYISGTGCWMVRSKWRSRNSRKRVSQNDNAWWLHCWDDESARTSSTTGNVRVNKSVHMKSRISITSLRNLSGPLLSILKLWRIISFCSFTAKNKVVPVQAIEAYGGVEYRPTYS
jgi:hypothetical protein